MVSGKVVSGKVVSGKNGNILRIKKSEDRSRKSVPRISNESDFQCGDEQSSCPHLR